MHIHIVRKNNQQVTLPSSRVKSLCRLRTQVSYNLIQLGPQRTLETPVGLEPMNGYFLKHLLKHPKTLLALMIWSTQPYANTHPRHHVDEID